MFMTPPGKPIPTFEGLPTEQAEFTPLQKLYLRIMNLVQTYPELFTVAIHKDSIGLLTLLELGEPFNEELGLGISLTVWGNGSREEINIIRGLHTIYDLRLSTDDRAANSYGPAIQTAERRGLRWLEDFTTKLNGKFAMLDDRWATMGGETLRWRDIDAYLDAATLKLPESDLDHKMVVRLSTLQSVFGCSLFDALRDINDES